MIKYANIIVWKFKINVMSYIEIKLENLRLL